MENTPSDLCSVRCYQCVMFDARHELHPLPPPVDKFSIPFYFPGVLFDIPAALLSCSPYFISFI